MTAGATREGTLGIEERRGVGAYAPVPVEQRDAAGRLSTAFVAPQAGTTVSRGVEAPEQYQVDAYGFARLMANAHDVMTKLEPYLQQQGTALQWWMLNEPNAIKDASVRAYAQQARVFINGQLRRESGAAITEAEWDNFRDAVSFRAGDDQGMTTPLKQKTRRTMVGNAVTEPGPSFSNEFVTMAELEALAAQRGTTVEQEAQRAAQERVTIIP